MDYVILFFLLVLILYLIVRDKIIARKRRKNHVMLERVSKKMDYINKELKKSNNLFLKLLDALSDE